METIDINSCFMWAVGLYTPVDFGYMIDENDLKGIGVEFDSHITMLYAQNRIIDKENILEDIKNLLGEDYQKFENLSKETKLKDVFDLFDLDYFENDSDYIILKLRDDSEIFSMLDLINKGLGKKYGIKSKFPNYTPHITLAELKPGKAKKYAESEGFGKIFYNSAVDFEDVIASYGKAGEIDKQFFLTQYKNVDRFFRIKNLRKEYEDLRKVK